MTYIKEVDANILENLSPIAIVKASNIIAETTTTSLTAKEDYIINVTSATSFVVGQYLTIYNVAEDRVYVANILAINTLAITLDTPLDFEFPIGSIVTVGSTNLNVDGSVTPQIFGFRNPTGTDIPSFFDVTRLMFKMLTTTEPDLTDFGDITNGLLRGLVLRKVDGTYQNIFNVKSNSEMNNIMYNFDIETVANNAQNGINARFTLSNLGAIVRLLPFEDLQLVVQDDLTGLTRFEIIAEGHIGI